MADGVKVRILGDDSDLNSKLKSAGVSVAKWAAASVAAAAAAGVAMTKSGLESADALAKEAQQLNTTSEDLAILQRSAEMAGVSQEKLASASRALTTRLAQASSGTGTAVDALKKLGIETDELEGMSLSDRIKTLNEALDTNVDSSERAAVAAALYGEEAALAVGKISSGTIETATQQVRDFGAALSEVDAAKIENANDTMSQMGLLTDAATQGMAAKFAPVLDAVADKIFDAAKESDGFGSAIDTAFDIAVSGAGLVADAVYAVQVAIKGIEVWATGMSTVWLNVATKMVEAFNWVSDSVVDAANVTIRAINSLPLVKLNEIVTGESEALATVTGWTDAARAAFQEARGELTALVNEPWPSDNIKAFVDEAVEAGQVAAEAVVKAREASGAGIDLSGGEEGDTSATDKMREELAAKVEAIRESLLSEQEARNEAYAVDQETLQQAMEAKLLTEQQYKEQQAALTDRYNAETLKALEDQAAAEKAIEKAKNDAKLSVASSAFGNLSSLMDTENRKLFEIGKAAALAQATIDGYQAIQSSYAAGAKIGGPITGAAFAATAAVATAVQISNIASTSFGSASGSSSSSATATSTTTSDATENAASAESAVSRSLIVQGDFDQNSLYSGTAVRNLMDLIAEQQADGYTVVL